MAVPERRVELRIDGVWTNVTDNVFVRNPINIRRGQADEAPRADPAKGTFTLNNRDGRYSPRNPYSPYYGLIGRNTPVRVAMRAGPTHLASDGGRLVAAAVPALNISGDIDIRVDAASDGVVGNAVVLASRWDRPTPDGRSWIFGARTDGHLTFEWTTDGTLETYRIAVATVPTLRLVSDRRTVLRVTVDVDHGGGGCTINFLRGQSLTGPWDIIGNSVAPAGTTSIYAGNTIPVELGANRELPRAGACRIYGAQIRNGIAGTVVASPDLPAQTPGSGSFVDSAGITWTVAGEAEITDFRTRFAGEVSAWPTSWDLSGRDIEVGIRAEGISRRLGQGASPLQSTLRRRLMSGNPRLIAYWPCEDGSDATYAASPLPGVSPLQVSSWSFSAATPPGGSASLPTVGEGAYAAGVVPAYAATGEWRTELVFMATELPTIDSQFEELYVLHTTGTVARHRVTSVLLSTGPNIGLTLINCQGFNSAGGTVYDTSQVPPSGFVGGWCRVAVYGRQVGGNVEVTMEVTALGGGVMWQPVGAYAGTVGVATGWSSGPVGYQGLAMGHISVWADADADPYASADDGYRLETAAARVARVADEEGVPMVVAGGDDLPSRVGPQPLDTFLNILGDAADVDGGQLHDRRHDLGMRLRGRRSVYNQEPALVLDYAAGEVAPYLEPVDDDQGVVNDVTVQRRAGAAGRVELETGPLSVQPPPAGVGRYDTALTLNLQVDGQAESHAGWRLALGTVDEARYPTVRVDLVANPHLIDEILDLDAMDRALLINPPAWIPPDDVDLLVRGYEETINVDQWAVELNCTPGSPWQAGEWGDDDTTRADTAGSTLAVPATQTATELVVATTLDAVRDHRPWVASAGPQAIAGQHPFDVRVGAEVVRVTAVDAWARDAFGRGVSNGWGTADVGGAWQELGGAASDRGVAFGVGGIVLAATPSTQRQQTILGDLGDVEMTVRIVIHQTSAGAAVLPGVLCRHTGPGDFYRIRVHAETGGTLSLSATRTTTQIGATVVPGLSYAPNDSFDMRVRLVGHRLLARIWPTGGAEPGLWHLDATVDAATIDAGRVGLVASAFAANSNVNPTISFDDFQLHTVQRMTVTRAINTVARGWPVGTAVRLARPMRIAL